MIRRQRIASCLGWVTTKTPDLWVLLTICWLCGIITPYGQQPGKNDRPIPSAAQGSRSCTPLGAVCPAGCLQSLCPCRRPRISTADLHHSLRSLSRPGLPLQNVPRHDARWQNGVLLQGRALPHTAGCNHRPLRSGSACGSCRRDFLAGRSARADACQFRLFD